MATENIPTQRVSGYVDGFNLFYGIRERGWKHLYWHDPYDLIQTLTSDRVTVTDVKYFTARVREPSPKRIRQTQFLDAIRSRGQCDIIQGKFSKRTIRCRGCRESWVKHEEKMTDSAIAAHLVADAFLNRFDTAILVGGDTDIVPAIRMVRTHFPNKTILAWYPPKRVNDAVGNLCHGSDQIKHDHIQAAVMPDSMHDADGNLIERPAEWVRPAPIHPTKPAAGQLPFGK